MTMLQNLKGAADAWSWPGAATGACILLATAISVQAEVVVVSSDMPNLKAGAEIADTARIEVSAGSNVRIMLPSGKTRALSGPLSASVADLVKGEPQEPSFWQKAKEFFATGGVDQSRQGATRAALSAKPAAQVFSWTSVHPNATGNVCVKRGATIVLSRVRAGKEAQATVIDTAANARGKAVWTAGALEASWPADLAPKPDTAYQIVAPDQPIRQIKLRLIDEALTSDALALKTLIEADCRAQAAAFIAGLAK